MKSIIELRCAVDTKEPLVWNDPDPIKDNDYTISWIEDLYFDIEEPILIQYNNGKSEAQVFLHEIIYKNEQTV